MKTVNNLPYLSTLLCAFFIILLLSGCENSGDALKLTTSKELLSPNHVKGIVIIESPKIGSLLHLRGIAGNGELFTRTEDKGECGSMPIKFVAGDFGGSSIGIDTREPIRLTIYSDDIIKMLTQGDKVVSKHYDITSLQDHNHGDIKIESGLTLNYGFVLRENLSRWSSKFGAEKGEISCEPLTLNTLDRPV